VANVGIHDNFFELGGDSLLAARLVSRIRKTMTTKISLMTMFQSPSVRQLAQRLDENADVDLFDAVLPLRSQGTLRPLFCLPPAWGLSWCYAGFVTHIEGDRPIYGLQVAHLFRGKALPQSIDEIATDFIARIRKIQPEGPYNLLGWSLGGLTAYTVASYLQKVGQNVSFLALVDPEIPRGSPPPVDHQAVLSNLLDRLHLETPAGPLAIATTTKLINCAWPILNEEHLAATIESFMTSEPIAATFTPTPFDGDLLFFASTIDRRDRLEPIVAWAPHVRGRIDVHWIDCLHDHMLRGENMVQIAKILAVELDKIRDE
jgi:thioesterase domain-containing protein/acyl carrier protein